MRGSGVWSCGSTRFLVSKIAAFKPELHVLSQVFRRKTQQTVFNNDAETQKAEPT